MRPDAFAPITLPDDAWTDPEMIEALRERRIGHVFAVALGNKAYGISQTRVANLTGMDQSEVSRIRTGKRKPMAIDLLERVADAFQMPDAARNTLGLASKETPAEVPKARPAEAVSIPAPTRTVAVPDVTADRTPSADVDRLINFAAPPKRVRPATIRALRDAISDYWRRDDQYGGEALRPAVVAQLRQSQDLLRESADAEQRSELLAITAELAQLAGWMHFDAQQYSTGRTYFEQALKLATENNDRNYVANILASLSLQATYEGRSIVDAVTLARAAQDACRSAATPRVMAMLSMREAFAHAALGDERSTRSAIDESHRQLQRADSWPDDPAWVSYFTERKLMVDTGIALSRLGDVQAAVPIIAQAVEQDDGTNARNYAFHTFWLAKTQADAGEIDQACVTASRTLEVAEGVDSPRVVAHVRELQAKLAHHRNSAAVLDFHHRATEFLRGLDY